MGLTPAGARHHNPSLPAEGMWTDEKITVTYWRSTMSDALAW
ncbi:hypothetical protein ACFYPC_36565 [Streptomyces sp. NPDC005808]